MNYSVKHKVKLWNSLFALQYLHTTPYKPHLTTTKCFFFCGTHSFFNTAKVELLFWNIPLKQTDDSPSLYMKRKSLNYFHSINLMEVPRSPVKWTITHASNGMFNNKAILVFLRQNSCINHILFPVLSFYTRTYVIQ